MAAPGGPSAQPQDPYGPVVDELLAELVVEATGTSENKEQVQATWGPLDDPYTVVEVKHDEPIPVVQAQSSFHDASGGAERMVYEGSDSQRGRGSRRASALSPHRRSSATVREPIEVAFGRTVTPNSRSPERPKVNQTISPAQNTSQRVKPKSYAEIYNLRRSQELPAGAVAAALAGQEGEGGAEAADELLEAGLATPPAQKLSAKQLAQVERQEAQLQQEMNAEVAERELEMARREMSLDAALLRAGQRLRQQFAEAEAAGGRLPRVDSMEMEEQARDAESPLAQARRIGEEPSSGGGAASSVPDAPGLVPGMEAGLSSDLEGAPGLVGPTFSASLSDESLAVKLYMPSPDIHSRLQQKAAAAAAAGGSLGADAGGLPARVSGAGGPGRPPPLTVPSPPVPSEGGASSPRMSAGDLPDSPSALALPGARLGMGMGMGPMSFGAGRLGIPGRSSGGGSLPPASALGGRSTVDEEEAAFVAQRVVRSRHIAEQLQRLQEESRRLQEQSKRLQERAVEMQREVGIPVPGAAAQAGAPVRQTSMPGVPVGAAGVAGPAVPAVVPVAPAAPPSSGSQQSRQAGEGPRRRSHAGAASTGAGAGAGKAAAGAAGPQKQGSQSVSRPHRTSQAGAASGGTPQAKGTASSTGPSPSEPSLTTPPLEPPAKSTTPTRAAIHWSMPQHRGPRPPLLQSPQKMSPSLPTTSGSPNPKSPTRLKHQAGLLQRSDSSASTVEPPLPRWSDQVASSSNTPTGSPSPPVPMPYRRFHSPLKTQPPPPPVQNQSQGPAPSQPPEPVQPQQPQGPPPAPLLHHRPPPRMHGSPLKGHSHPPPAMTTGSDDSLRGPQSLQGSFVERSNKLGAGAAAGAIAGMGAPAAAPSTLAQGLLAHQDSYSQAQPAAPGHKPRKFLPEVQLPSQLLAKQNASVHQPVPPLAQMPQAGYASAGYGTYGAALPVYGSYAVQPPAMAAPTDGAKAGANGGGMDRSKSGRAGGLVKSKSSHLDTSAAAEAVQGPPMMMGMGMMGAAGPMSMPMAGGAYGAMAGRGLGQGAPMMMMMPPQGMAMGGVMPGYGSWAGQPMNGAQQPPSPGRERPVPNKPAAAGGGGGAGGGGSNRARNHGTHKATEPTVQHETISYGVLPSAAQAQAYPIAAAGMYGAPYGMSPYGLAGAPAPLMGHPHMLAAGPMAAAAAAAAGSGAGGERGSGGRKPLGPSSKSAPVLMANGYGQAGMEQDMGIRVMAMQQPMGAGGMYGVMYPGGGAAGPYASMMQQRAEQVAAEQEAHYRELEQGMMSKLDRQVGRMKERRRSAGPDDGERPPFRLF